MKRIFVVASFSGDARDFLRYDLGVNDREAVIVTPTSRRQLHGQPGEYVLAMYDIRRAGNNDRSDQFLDHELDYWLSKNPGVQMEVRSR